MTNEQRKTLLLLLQYNPYVNSDGKTFNINDRFLDLIGCVRLKDGSLQYEEEQKAIDARIIDVTINHIKELRGLE